MSNTTKPNLPIESPETSDSKTQDFFDGFGSTTNYNTKEFDQAYGFFKAKSFNSDAARTLAFDFLKVVKENDMDLTALLQELDSSNGMELNYTLALIFNKNRERTSQLGFRQTRTALDYVQRTIIA